MVCLLLLVLKTPTTNTFNLRFTNTAPDKSRRCLYYAIGFVEDLSMDDLKELAQLEESQN